MIPSMDRGLKQSIVKSLHHTFSLSSKGSLFTKKQLVLVTWHYYSSMFPL